MSIITEIEKIVFSKLTNIEDINIYSCPEKNSSFPYLLINIDDVEIENNFDKDIYSVSLNVSIFDKNESNINILNLSIEVKEQLIDLSNSETNNFNIINVNFLNLTTSLFNEVNSIWNTKINFNILLQKTI